MIILVKSNQIELIKETDRESVDEKGSERLTIQFKADDIILRDLRYMEGEKESEPEPEGQDSGGEDIKSEVEELIGTPEENKIEW